MKTSAMCVAIAAMISACRLYEQNAPCPCSDGWTCCPGAHVCAETADQCPASQGEIQWQQTRSMAGEMPVAGIDSDGKGGLWIAYQIPSEVHVVHLDASGGTLTDWTYTDAISPIHGVAFAGDSLWIAYAGLPASQQFLRRLDATTGSELQRFATSYGVSDIAADNDELLLLQYGVMSVLDPTTGGVRSHTSFNYEHADEGIGIAAVGSLVWLAAWDSDTVVLADRDGNVQRQGNVPYLGQASRRDMFLAWDGTSLIVEVDNQILWLTPQGSGSVF
jgi:hypothetical protein